MNTLSLDGLISYDPISSAYAFSPFGYSGSYAGFGDTEAARVNTGVQYRLSYQNFRIGALAQWGGYDQGNGSKFHVSRPDRRRLSRLRRQAVT